MVRRSDLQKINEACGRSIFSVLRDMMFAAGGEWGRREIAYLQYAIVEAYTESAGPKTVGDIIRIANLRSISEALAPRAGEELFVAPEPLPNIDVATHGLSLWSNWYSCRTGHGNHAILHLRTSRDIGEGRGSRKRGDMLCRVELCTIDQHLPHSDELDGEGRLGRKHVCPKCLAYYDRYLAVGRP